ncbi:MAG: hypothetical protein LBT97_06645, partial [Planctomycetota bacterium]|nr:hypothetical protein [Planctomycetota bacterium]
FFVRSGDTADLAIIPDAKCKPKTLWRESNGGLFDFLQKSTKSERRFDRFPSSGLQKSAS